MVSSLSSESWRFVPSAYLKELKGRHEQHEGRRRVAYQNLAERIGRHQGSEAQPIHDDLLIDLVRGCGLAEELAPEFNERTRKEGERYTLGTDIAAIIFGCFAIYAHYCGFPTNKIVNLNPIIALTTGIYSLAAAAVSMDRRAQISRYRERLRQRLLNEQ